MTHLRKLTMTGRRGGNDLQTPGAALTPLLRYIPQGWTIWECCAGKGNLVFAARRADYTVVASDIAKGTIGDRVDFLRDDFSGHYDCIVTNPPYRTKQRFVERCYELGRPWALLLPVGVLGNAWAQRLFAEYGMKILLLDRRVNFLAGRSGSWFSSAWYTYGLPLPSKIVYGRYVPADLPRRGGR